MFYNKKGKPITIEIACIRKMMKLINRKMSDYYRRVSLDALTPVSEPSYEIKEEVMQDYTEYYTIVKSLNLTENMRIALECRQNGLSYPAIGRVLSREQATVYEYFTKCVKDIRRFTDKQIPLFCFNSLINFAFIISCEGVANRLDFLRNLW